MKTYQYVVVRKDIPDGLVAAMVLHAAGEAVQAQGRKLLMDGTPALGWEDIVSLVPHSTRASVLEANDEAALEAVYAHAKNRNRTPIVRIVESEGEHAGQLMALGFTPCNRNILQPSLGALKPWRAG